MEGDVMTDRLLYEREHRMNSSLINENSRLRAIRQDDRAKIRHLEAALIKILDNTSVENTWASREAEIALGSQSDGEVK